MNNSSHDRCKQLESNDKRPDLLTHRYRPDCAERLGFNSEQGLHLKTWIQNFISLKDNSSRQSYHDYSDDSNSGSQGEYLEVARKCVLLTGPPGVGKTSLVYTIANELKLHVVESHSSEKRDCKVFNMFKLTNQKGKINPLAKMFQAAQQAQQAESSRKKRRKLNDNQSMNSNPNGPQFAKPQSLSLSGDTSIVLFDDVDVVFEEDGPFFKSLVELIKESKRPVILTATQNIDRIKKILVHYEHIHLNKPTIEGCAKLLTDICRLEKFHKLGKSSRCQTVASYFDCDIRQSLNSIHFYGDLADRSLEIASDTRIQPKFDRISNLVDPANDTNRSALLNCYTNLSLVDVINSKFHFSDRSTLLNDWLDGKPSHRHEEHDFAYDLVEQIRESIIEFTEKLNGDELMSDKELSTFQRQRLLAKNDAEDMSRKINEKIKSRIEPPEKEFYTDIVPLFGEIVRLESQKRLTTKGNSNSNMTLNFRRSRRTISYLESIAVYLEPEDAEVILRTLPISHDPEVITV